VTAQTLARHFGSIDALARATQEEIQDVEGMGPLRAESIADWFAEEDNLRLIDDIRKLGLNLESGDELKPIEGPLSGNSYVITGTLESMTREEAAAELEVRGAKVAGSVSKNTTALIIGDEPGGTKFNKARQLGTPMLDESAFKELLASSPAEASRSQVPSAPPTRFGR
jgi:DNA ligase (NAD+)